MPVLNSSIQASILSKLMTVAYHRRRQQCPSSRSLSLRFRVRASSSPLTHRFFYQSLDLVENLNSTVTVRSP
jgi:hypothetical protein